MDAMIRMIDLRARHDRLVAEQPRLRMRERAAALQVSEAELVAADCGLSSYELDATPQTLLRALPALGPVMALSRNDACVHERHGRYEDVRIDGAVGLVLGPDIDLRIFFEHWVYAYAVIENERHSLQFFDAAGVAVHKTYRTAATDARAWDALVARHALEHKRPVQPAALAPLDEADTPQDPAALRAHWLGLQDTHEFYPMLRRFKVSRLGALRAAGADLAQPVDHGAVERTLHIAAASALPLMCFVSNRGIVQIHTGPVQRLLRTGPWFNVLDERFNLHLDTTAIASCWVVNKPTRDGWVTSLEAYAADGRLIVQFFGARKPGQPELPAWRRLLADLCPQPLAA
ncbi:hemin-degrading factor [Caldimonas manganoxidans]|uniref:hemin-degrading factor n=1 Tax=Caldimonas manganoxidans TaxID=196015 RepID=UPI00037B617C|nr:hemin-degrading factor [Caldimonas manganoxidans]